MKFNIILTFSTQSYQRYKLPSSLITFLKGSIYTKYSKNQLKYFIKQQIFVKDNDFVKNYIVINNDIPIIIKELNVIIE